MSDLIDELLDYSKLAKSNLRFENIDLDMLINTIIDEMFSDVKECIQLRKLPTVIGDFKLLKRLFTNLISNAVKYSSKEKKPKVTITSETKSRSIRVLVKDNGVGFDMRNANKLFKIFHRLHHEDEFKGTGVGLALCKKIMDIHKGQIKAHSELGKGSVFKVCFNHIEEFNLEDRTS